MKLLFFDIDNTLCEFGKAPGPRTLAAIRRARQRGHLAFLCTGRAPSAISPQLKAAGFDGIVAAAGSYAELRGQVLLNETLPPALLAKTIEVLSRNQVIYTLECYQGSYTSMRTSELLASQPDLPPEVLKMQCDLERSLCLQPLANNPGEPVYKLCFVCRDAAQLEEPTALLAGDYDIILQKNSFPGVRMVVGELIPRSRTKGTALEAVCRACGKTAADAVAFGDSPNDLPMLEAAGTAVVMGDADPSLQKLADWVCPSCREQGVADALEHLGLA